MFTTRSGPSAHATGTTMQHQEQVELLKKNAEAIAEEKKKLEAQLEKLEEETVYERE
jgi:cell division protein FtsB